jgi:hypothetical protein
MAPVCFIRKTKVPKQRVFHDYCKEWFVNALECLSDKEKVEIDGVSTLVSWKGDGKEQDRHVELTPPNKQFIISCTDEVPCTIVYEPVPVEERVQNMNGLLQLWSGYHGKFEACGFPCVQDLWEDMDRIMEQAGLSRLDPLLRDFSATLLIPCDLVIKPEFKVKLLNMGEAVMIGSNCLHNAPAFNEGRVVLFVPYAKYNKVAGRASNADDSDVQWTGQSLIPDVYAEAYREMSDESRKTLLVIFGWYVVIGMCQGNPLRGTFIDFPHVIKFMASVDVKFNQMQKKAKGAVKSCRDLFGEKGEAKAYAAKLFRDLPNLVEKYVETDDFFSTRVEQVRKKRARQS